MSDPRSSKSSRILVTHQRRTRLACGLATPRIRQGRAPITARAAHTATAEMAKADAAVGVVAAQAAWLLFVVFSLTSPRAPGDESNDGSNAKGARGSGRSKWRRGRRRCLLATARHWGAGAEDGEERRCGAAGDHGGGARNASAADDGDVRLTELRRVSERSGAAALPERSGGVSSTTLLRQSDHPRVAVRQSGHRQGAIREYSYSFPFYFTEGASWDQGRRQRITKAAPAVSSRDVRWRRQLQQQQPNLFDWRRGASSRAAPRGSSRTPL